MTWRRFDPNKWTFMRRQIRLVWTQLWQHLKNYGTVQLLFDVGLTSVARWDALAGCLHALWCLLMRCLHGVIPGESNWWLQTHDVAECHSRNAHRGLGPEYTWFLRVLSVICVTMGPSNLKEYKSSGQKERDSESSTGQVTVACSNSQYCSAINIYKCLYRLLVIVPLVALTVVTCKRLWLRLIEIASHFCSLSREISNTAACAQLPMSKVLLSLP